MTNQTTIIEPTLPEVHMNLVTPREPVIGRVVSNDLCMKGKSSSFVRHTVIDVAGTPLEGKCLSGQSFGVLTPGTNEKGKPHKVRLYSIANGSKGENGQPNLISTTPKRLVEEYTSKDDPDSHALFTGICSNFLCDLKPGDEVRVSGPNGKRFLLPVDPNEHDYLFLATGTGIAPFRGFCLDLLEDPDTPCTSNIHLVMGTPYRTDLLYDDFFTSLAEKHDNFQYHTAISREAHRGNPRGIYTHNLIDEEIETFAPLLSNPKTLIYMCGLLGMNFGFYQILAKHELNQGYCTTKEDLAGTSWETWTNDQMKRSIRPTERMMVEVY